MKYLIVFFCSLIPLYSLCQRSEQVYEIAEQMPQFPDGDDSLRHYLLHQLNYPEYSKSHHIEGRVDVRFTVNEDGHLSDIKVVKGEVPDINAEAIRVVKTFPDFIPGVQDGRRVKVTIILPIVFQLSENDGKRKKRE